MVLVFAICAWKRSPSIAADNARLRYMGRIGHGSGASIMYWSGSSVTMNFKGTSVKAVLKDEKGDNYYYVIVDSNNITKLKADSGKRDYELVSGLPDANHTIQLYKLTEISKGKTWFYGFEINHNGHILEPPPVPLRKIEFYGNSITSGYSLEDSVGDSRESKFYNNYYSYAAITARHYGAEFHCISRSGIGIMVSWSPEIMPEIYDHLDPYDANSKWDFSQFTPSIVVINLFQNDYWLLNKPEFPQYKIRFGSNPPNERGIIDAYKKFVSSIRDKYPNASIICTLGSMDATAEGSPWPGYIKTAVAQLGDKKIYTHFFPYRNSPGHPKKKEQRENAESLIKFIDENVGFK